MADTTKTPAAKPRAKAKATAAKARTTISSAASTVSEEAHKARDTATETVRKGATRLSQQAADKARSYAIDGKTKASDALSEFSKLMTNAAGSVDDRLGNEYGDYARSAANSLAGFSESLRGKDVDDLLNDARDFVKKSPAVAIGVAAAVGFVLARLVKSGLDADGDA